MVNKNQIKMIERSLLTEYEKSEVDEMLLSAEFSVLDNGNVNVKYENGIVDRFVLVSFLVHDSELDLYGIDKNDTQTKQQGHQKRQGRTTSDSKAAGRP